VHHAPNRAVRRSTILGRSETGVLERGVNPASLTSFRQEGTFKLMKVTDYFKYVRQRPDRRWIREEWIQSAVEQPDAKFIQADGRIRIWKKITEAEGRYLRVVLLADGETVHNAFIDRRFRGA